ncbi:MOSC domain-containing protein [Spirosoma sp. KUDC1026]|uniref:MOSC domain-containing protein n=1 Tax=Spirosoma sp. KUDC1026 TaxID=2745947 RepID=UPI00159BB9E7|nr:MOSC N-terminal beta barrel domain-containing protein [Spirosoma sp. KUDC1026]QKZ12513.1 MOSC domain-containing protein [Spirosoma sp. KUDC1026]
MTVSELYIYPIKSIGGISIAEATVEGKGFRYDRRFMLVEPTGDDKPWPFITQRTHPQMALIDVAIDNASSDDAQLRVWHRQRPDDVLTLPLVPASETVTESVRVSIWDSLDVAAVTVSDAADRWFSAALGFTCRLVYMPATTNRQVDQQYAKPGDAVSFADGYPYLLISQSSLDELNRRLSEPVEMRRFRPNIIVSGAQPNEEDAWQQFQIGELDFYGVKPCARCVLTTIDPETAQKGKEPLATLATYRRWNKKILLGQNVLTSPTATGVVRVGQPVTIVNRQEPWLAPPVSL